MVSVITGDIVNSRRATSASWLKILKKELSKLGGTPKQWEIYRGDSFQVEIKNPADALGTAIQIKAAVKTLKGMDVRMAIGIGDKSYSAKKITESNGTAFINSGEMAEMLKRLKLNLSIKSTSDEFNYEMNLYIKLALVIMDGWTKTASETMYTVLLHPNKSQEEIGKLLGIPQSAVSRRLKRACYSEITELIEMYRNKASKLK